MSKEVKVEVELAQFVRLDSVRIITQSVFQKIVLNLYNIEIEVWRFNHIVCEDAMVFVESLYMHMHVYTVCTIVDTHLTIWCWVINQLITDSAKIQQENMNNMSLHLYTPYPCGPLHPLMCYDKVGIFSLIWELWVAQRLKDQNPWQKNR